MHTRLGDLRQPAPVAWEESPSGERSSVACAWRVLEGGRFGFEVTARDPGRRLVIDPGLIWSKLFGGSSDDDPGYDAIAVSAGGNINVAGVAVSTDFPTTVGAYQTTLMGNGTCDAWVARFAPSGVLLWSTYLGGIGFEWARGLAIGPNDTVTVVGSTSSANFPFVAGFDSSFNGLGGLSVGDGFLATFNPALAGIAQLTWSTLLGGFNDDRLNSVAVDASGIVTAAGWTYSFNIPGITPPNAFRSAPQGSQDAIVCRFNPALVGNAQLVWFTFLGGSTNDYIGPIAVEPNGQVVIHGETSSSNFPTRTRSSRPTEAAPGTRSSPCSTRRCLPRASSSIRPTSADPATRTMAASPSTRRAASRSAAGRARRTFRPRPLRTTRRGTAGSTRTSRASTRRSRPRASSCSRPSSAVRSTTASTTSSSTPRARSTRSGQSARRTSRRPPAPSSRRSRAARR